MAETTEPDAADRDYPYLPDDSIVNVQRGPEPGGI
jgi:hypothetical protein